MGKKLNLKGKVFGRLTVIKEFGNDGTKHKRVLWLCKCDCGNESVVMASKLTFGHTKSCGCYRTDMMRKVCKVNLLGKKFGRLSVIGECGSYLGRVKWLCRCDCGNEIIVVGKSLRNGNTLSCGCYRKDRIKECTSAEKHWNWHGGITDVNQKIRDVVKKNWWVVEIFYRDGYTCQKCGVRGGNLHAHHIIPFKEIINYCNITTVEKAKNCALLFDINNGITLCEDCHRWAHNNKNMNKKFIRGLEKELTVCQN